jgi:hypothetical protein
MFLNLVLIVIMLLMLSWIIFMVRYGADFKNISLNISNFTNYLYDSLFVYHIVPFEILSRSMHDKEILSLGPCVLLSFLKLPIDLLIKISGGTVDSSFATLGSLLNSTIIFVGTNFYNAFSTIILPPFIDAGYVGVFIYFSIYGWLMQFCKKRSLGLFLFYILFFGLFQPINVSALFFMPLFYFLIFNIFPCLSVRLK